MYLLLTHALILTAILSMALLTQIVAALYRNRKLTFAKPRSIPRGPAASHPPMDHDLSWQLTSFRTNEFRTNEPLKLDQWQVMMFIGRSRLEHPVWKLLKR